MANENLSFLIEIQRFISHIQVSMLHFYLLMRYK